MKSIRRTLELCALAGLLVVLGFLPAKLPYLEKPNVIVISIDSLRADHMSLYGYGRDTTPNIDTFSQNAYVFNNYFSTSYLTPVSEASVQTGEYPFTNGLISFSTTMRGTDETLAEILKGQGYMTAAFGSSPEYRTGGTLATSFSRGFSVYQPFPQDYADVYAARAPNAPVADALTWLTKKGGVNRPFYLWLPLGGVHQPFNDASPAVFDDPTYTGFFASTTNDFFPDPYAYLYGNKRYAASDVTRGPSSVVGSLAAADSQRIVDRYDDGVRATDAALAPLFAYLKTSGLNRNTIVILESEHGETLGERGYFWHYDIYDETTHVPLVIRVPWSVGGRVQALASGVDVMPTLLSLLHIQTPSNNGVDYAPFLSGATTTAPRSDVYITRTPLWEVTGSVVPALEKSDATAHYHDTAIRSAKWLLIHRLARAELAQYGWWQLLTGVHTESPEYELYDVQRDPGETTNVYQAHANDAAVAALQAQLDAYDTEIAHESAGLVEGSLQPYF